MSTAVLDQAITAPAVAEADEVRPAPSRRDRLAIPSLVGAMTVSNIGNNLTGLAAPWFVLITTGSAARTGVVAAAVALATTIGGFFGGTVVDRIGFKRASIISDIASGFFVALIPTFYYLDMLTFPLLVSLAFMASLLDAPGWSARRSMLPELSRRTGTSLERSNSFVEIAQAMSSFIGPLLAGVLISVMSVASVLYLDTAGFIISALIIGVAISMPHVRRAPNGEPGAAHQSLFQESTEGARFMVRLPVLRSMIIVGVIANFIINPIFAVAIPVLAKRTWDDPRALGLLFAGFGIGALIGVGLYGVIGPRVPRYPVFVGGILLGAGALWLVPATEYLAVSVVGAIAMGIGIGPLNVISMTVIQEIVPEELLGRVMGALGAMTQISAPIGMLLAGVAIELFSVQSVIFFAAAAFSVLIIAAVSMPVFRQLERGALANGQ